MTIPTKTLTEIAERLESDGRMGFIEYMEKYEQFKSDIRTLLEGYKALVVELEKWRTWQATAAIAEENDALRTELKKAGEALFLSKQHVIGNGRRAKERGEEGVPGLALKDLETINEAISQPILKQLMGEVEG